VIPYGVYDVAFNESLVNLAQGSDTGCRAALKIDRLAAQRQSSNSSKCDLYFEDEAKKEKAEVMVL